MKKSIIVLMSLLFVVLFALSGCAGTAGGSSISEDEALAVALEDAGIQETAAEDLAIEATEVDGKAVYVISFVWSGFDYQYTIDASSGEIIETMFDGEVL